jgi:hypothetical protein
MTEQEVKELDARNWEDLKEMAHWYGFKELRRMIDEIENNENEAAAERFYSNSDNHVSAGERAEQQHRNQLLK